MNETSAADTTRKKPVEKRSIARCYWEALVNNSSVKAIGEIFLAFVGGTFVASAVGFVVIWGVMWATENYTLRQTFYKSSIDQWLLAGVVSCLGIAMACQYLLLPVWQLSVKVFEEIREDAYRRSNSEK